MKLKVTLLIFILLLSTFGLVSAASRWSYVESTQNATVYVDTETLYQYTGKSDGEKYTNCWLRYEYSDCIIITHLNIHNRNLRYLVKEYNKYDKNGNVISEDNKNSNGWQTSVPGSYLESIIKNVINRLGADA